MKQQEASLGSAPIYITANTLMNNDVTLDEALQIARDAGADGFELRRELLPLTVEPAAVEHIRAQLLVFPLPPVYSIPLPVFNKGRFEKEPILHALIEAHSFGCRLVKFAPIGMEPGEREFAELGELRSLLHSEAIELVVTIENDQSAASGDLGLWERFFEKAAALDCPIWMTFDLGNWTCVGRDVIEAARRLGQYVAYIHAKSVELQEGQCISQPIHVSPTHHPALFYLPTDVPRAIEFPITVSDHDTVTTRVRDYISWLRSGNFVL